MLTQSVEASDPKNRYVSNLHPLEYIITITDYSHYHAIKSLLDDSMVEALLSFTFLLLNAIYHYIRLSSTFTLTSSTSDIIRYVSLPSLPILPTHSHW